MADPYLRGAIMFGVVYLVGWFLYLAGCRQEQEIDRLRLEIQGLNRLVDSLSKKEKGVDSEDGTC
jgi:outer membrane murein-binding lipoprotein Lpp